MKKILLSVCVLSALSLGAATFEEIVDKARTLKRPAVVKIPAGTYRLSRTLKIGPEMSGLTFRADGEVTVSGGREVIGWKRHEGDIWVADVPWVSHKHNFRMLTVNGEPRPIAKSPDTPFKFHLAWGGGGRLLVHEPGVFDTKWKDVENGEVTLYHFWTDTHLRIKKIEEGTNRVHFVSPARKGFGTGIRNNEEGPNNAWYIIENLYALMDKPGEWYLDEIHAKLYYYAKPGEDMTKAKVVAPYVETLVSIEGVPARDGRWVEDVAFEGIRFADANYTLPLSEVNNMQASAVVTAAVVMRGAKRCVFRGCAFRNVTGYAVDFRDGARDCAVEKCDMRHLGAGGVRLCGSGDEFEPFKAVRRNRVTDSSIVEYGRRYLSAVGVLVQHASETLVKDNVIHDGFYTGVSVGWVWGYRHSVAWNNVIEGNEISKIGQGVLSDMGGIYTLGFSSGTILRANRINDVDARCYGGWGIYNDEGSTGILVENNVVWNTKFGGYDIHYARECVVRNNIFALGRLEQLSFTIPEAHTTCYFYNNILYWKTGKLFEGNWGDHPYLYYYHPRRPMESRADSFRIDRNVYFNPTGSLAETFFGHDVMNNDRKGVSFAEWQARGHDLKSVWADPGFAAPEKGDFTLKSDSPALRLGFSVDGVPLKSRR